LISTDNLDVKHPTGRSITKVCFYSITNHTQQATCKRFAVAEFPFQVLVAMGNVYMQRLCMVNNLMTHTIVAETPMGMFYIKICNFL